MDHMKFETPDLTAQNIDKIAALFPNCVTETLDEERSTPEKKAYKRAINFETLKQMLSPDVLEGDECYEFTWVGKKASIVEANKPIRRTLRPCPEESKNWDTTENLYIEGDNLEVLKLLQESYLGILSWMRLLKWIWPPACWPSPAPRISSLWEIFSSSPMCWTAKTFRTVRRSGHGILSRRSTISLPTACSPPPLPHGRRLLPFSCGNTTVAIPRSSISATRNSTAGNSSS